MAAVTRDDAVEILGRLGVLGDDAVRSVAGAALTAAAARILGDALRVSDGGLGADEVWAVVELATRVAAVAAVFCGDPDGWWDGPEGRAIAEASGALVGVVR